MRALDGFQYTTAEPGRRPERLTIKRGIPRDGRVARRLACPAHDMGHNRSTNCRRHQYDVKCRAKCYWMSCIGLHSVNSNIGMALTIAATSTSKTPSSQGNFKRYGKSNGILLPEHSVLCPLSAVTPQFNPAEATPFT